MVIVRGRMLRNIDFRVGAVGQLAKAGGKIGVRMTVENGDDAHALALRLSKIIIDIAFRIDHGSFAVRAEKIGSMSESLDKKAF